MKIAVIGAGLAGTLICNELAKNHEVTLLEIGQKDAIHYPQLYFPGKQLAGVKTFCFGGGGTTNLWHNGLIPIQQQDVVSQTFKTVLSEAEVFHDKAAEKLHWLDLPYSETYQKVCAKTTALAQNLGCFPDGVDCLLYPKKFSPLEVDPAVRGIYSVSRIDFIMNSSQIVSLKCTVGSVLHSIPVDCVVLSAGTLGTPMLVQKLLTAAGCSSSGAGVGLADHPLGFVGKLKVKKSYNDAIKQLSVLDWKNFESRTGIRVKSRCGNYTSCAFLRPALTMENKLSVYKYKSLLGASSGFERFKNMFDWRLFHPDILAEIVSHLFGVTIPGRFYNILFLFEQKRGAGSVRGKGDGIQVDWQITPKEMEIYRGMVNQLKQMLSPIADEIILEKEMTDDWLWSAAHHSGTVSMGRGTDDLVDTNLKLNGCDNAFVCDGSIIQEHSYANTGLTIGALAMRLAKRINDEQQ